MKHLTKKTFVQKGKKIKTFYYCDKYKKELTTKDVGRCIRRKDCFGCMLKEKGD